MVKVIAEVIGIIGIICSILSFQCSQRKNVMLFQVLASLMFCTQLFLVGAVTGACLDSINFFRSLFFSIDKKWAKSNWWLALFIAAVNELIAMTSIVIGILRHDIKKKQCG